MKLVDLVYDLLLHFPADERFAMSQQMRRAASSIPANIAEGYGRKHRAEYLHHLSYSFGSLCELETFLIISSRRKYATKDELKPIWSQAQVVGKMLNKLIASLKDND